MNELEELVVLVESPAPEKSNHEKIMELYKKIDEKIDALIRRSSERKIRTL